MSMAVHTATVKRFDSSEATQDSTGGLVQSYTTAARGSLETLISCRAIRMTSKEKIDHGIRESVIGWKFLFQESDPSITLEDRIEFEYTSGDLRVVKVTVPSEARSADAAFWKVIGVEDKTENYS